MATDRHPAPGEESDGFRHLRAAFELDGAAARLGHDAGGVAERDLRRLLIAAEGQVDDNERMR